MSDVLLLLVSMVIFCQSAPRKKKEDKATVPKNHIVLEEVLFLKHFNPECGGAVYVSCPHMHVRLLCVEFQACEASLGGGGAFIRANSSLVRDTSFQRCIVPSKAFSGQSFHSVCSSTVIASVVISQCGFSSKKKGHEAAIVNGGCQSLKQLNITNNLVSHFAASLLSIESLLFEFTHSLVRNCTSPDHILAFIHTRADDEVSDVIITRCRVQTGGLIFFGGGFCSLRRFWIIRNEGEVFNYGPGFGIGYAEVDDCVIDMSLKTPNPKVYPVYTLQDFILAANRTVPFTRMLIHTTELPRTGQFEMTC